ANIIIYLTTSEDLSVNLHVKLPATNQTEFRQYLFQNPLTITYELAIKNPGIKIIEESDIRSYYTEFNHIDVVDFYLFPDQKIITGESNNLHKNFIFENAKEVTYNQARDPNFIPDDNFNWYIRPSDGGFSLVVPKGFLRNTTEARNYFQGKSVLYELAQP